MNTNSKHLHFEMNVDHKEYHNIIQQLPRWATELGGDDVENLQPFYMHNVMVLGWTQSWAWMSSKVAN